MLIVWLFQALIGVAALLLCGFTARAVLKSDRRAPFWLTVTGSLGLVFFVSVPGVAVEMVGVALLAIVAGILMTPAPNPALLEETSPRRPRQ